jgi:hypothetical protein
MEHALSLAAAGGCSPNYFNGEGAMDRVSPEMQMLLARSIEDFLRVIKAWREEGSMQGVEVEVRT